VRAAEARKKLGNTSNRSFLGDSLKTKDKKKDSETKRSQTKESRRASLSVVEEPLQIIDGIRKKALTQKRSQSELIRLQVQEFTSKILTSEKEVAEGVVGHAEQMVSLMLEQRQDSFCRSLGRQLVSQVSLLLKKPDAALSSTVKSRLGALVSSITAAEGLSETKEEQKVDSAETELREAVGKLTIKRLTVSSRQDIRSVALPSPALRSLAQTTLSLFAEVDGCTDAPTGFMWKSVSKWLSMPGQVIQTARHLVSYIKRAGLTSSKRKTDTLHSMHEAVQKPLTDQDHASCLLLQGLLKKALALHSSLEALSAAKETASKTKVESSPVKSASPSKASLSQVVNLSPVKRSILH
jgi:uncharacterized protein (UPF0179 family)